MHGHALGALCKAQLNGKCPKFAILGMRREVAEAGRKEAERRRRRRQRKRDAVDVRHG